jgi:hypothetical protein
VVRTVRRSRCASADNVASSRFASAVGRSSMRGIVDGPNTIGANFTPGAISNGLADYASTRRSNVTTTSVTRPLRTRSRIISPS